MSGLKVLRERIGTVKSTRKITSAMKMVAAAKLRRAQDMTTRSRPYSQAMERMLAVAAENTATSECPPILAPPPPSPKRQLFVVASGDRGLCGSFNSSIARRARRDIDATRERGVDVRIFAIGRKTPDQLGRKYRSMIIDHRPIDTQPPPEFPFAVKIAEDLMESFHKGEFETAHIVFAYFRSAISQITRVHRLIPFPRTGDIVHASDAAAKDETAPPSPKDGHIHPVMLFEPDAEVLFARLLIHNLAFQIYRALLENAASEHGARMSAMDNATRNAEDMIARLTLEYNRTRQAVITSELIEIISGAEAL